MKSIPQLINLDRNRQQRFGALLACPYDRESKNYLLLPLLLYLGS